MVKKKKTVLVCGLRLLYKGLERTSADVSHWDLTRAGEPETARPFWQTSMPDLLFRQLEEAYTMLYIMWALIGFEWTDLA